MKKLRALDPLLNPVEPDLLLDYDFGDKFYQFICHSVKPPFAISIDGEWGSGKTTLLKTLHDTFEHTGYPVFWFNPWEYRQTPNVVLSFLQCMAAKYPHLWQKTDRKIWPFLSILLEKGINEGVKQLSNGIIDLEKAQDALENQLLLKNENTVELLKSEFQRLIAQISQNYDNRPVIIFFDDLDRCLPEDTIALLEALKNLFVTRDCQAVFVCGIDTRVAKQFIQAYYKGLGETYAINYFRKIFNLTFSIPFNKKINELLASHINELFEWEKPQAKALADTIYSRGIQAGISSVRKYLNIVYNIYAFFHFYPDYKLTPGGDLMVHLQIIREAWQPLYENIIHEAFKEPGISSTRAFIEHILKIPGFEMSMIERKFLEYYFVGSADYPFTRVNLNEFLCKYPALA